MREILYRGKGNPIYNDGEWYEGFLIQDKDGDYQIFSHGCCRTTVLKETIGQYTGFKDKNGKKIFEGDVVTYFDKEYLNSEVILADGCFMFRFISEFTQKIRQADCKMKLQ